MALNPQDGDAKAGGSGATVQGGSKKKKNAHGNRPHPQGGNGGSCLIHPTARHSATDCREIQKLAKRVSGRREQASKDGSPPPRQRSGNEKASDSETAVGEKELGYQSPAQELKGVYSHDNSGSDNEERRKKLYVMYGGSWELVSRRDVKTLRREVLSAKPGVPKAAPHHRWRNTTISFGPSDCLENMAGTGVLPLVTAPVIANIRLYHVLIDGGAGLNVISYAAFKQLQIPESKLTPSRPFSEVGPHPVFPLGSITLPVTFGTEENFRTESVQFNVAEVNLPFNAIIGRTALYRLLAIAHYGYLVLKMPSPAGVLTVRGDRTAAVAAVEKLHALASEAAHSEGDPSTSRARAPAKAHKVQPFDPDDVPVKTVQIGADSSRTTRIAGNLEEK